ncbi:MAG: hypothetical protein GOVbin2066_57 [Prokaryotic dsDNA virus sp.]|nr:MAG: hypothetical protein GOVbin2066_57 [Prokaryotic dsDNA virus sp.]|tara:strand:- start:4631 stop:5071 length:441 start_codon:yes stop_codon:yes gene_type:complete
MPFISNVLSTGKMKRRARKVPKLIGPHTGVSDWNDHVVTSQVSSDQLLVRAPSSRGGETYQDITVESGIKYRFAIKVVGCTGSGKKMIKLGTTSDNDSYASVTVSTYSNSFARGTFTSTSTTLRLTLTLQSADATINVGQILIEEV